MQRSYLVLLAALSATFATSAMAAVGAEEAKQLGGSALTAWGAEKAGNKDGSIPAYTGETIKVPSDYGSGGDFFRHPDPFKDEKPLFSITAQNVAQYAERLTEGQKALFKLHANYRMDIYPTHRTAQFPKYVLDNTLKNATSCKAEDGEMKLTGCYGGFAFPLPKTGSQVMWNHLTAFEAFAWEGFTSNWLVPPNNAPVLQAMAHCLEETPYYNPEQTAANGDKVIFWRVLCEDTSPARRVGQKVLLLDALDQINVGRRAYQYIPGQRRVKLAPDLSYDTPNIYTSGASTMDDAKGFAGALDRFEWKLIGKQEKYIIYNNFKLIDYKGSCPDSKLTETKYFPNPDCMRWELHRVWVVEGKLKPGFRHIYAKRTMYWDEDGFTAGQTEAYDSGNSLYRITFPLHYTLYEAKSATGGTTISLDLRSGIWGSNGTTSCAGCGWVVRSKTFGDNKFSPEGLAGEGVR